MMKSNRIEQYNYSLENGGVVMKIVASLFSGSRYVFILGGGAVGGIFKVVLENVREKCELGGVVE